MKVEQVIVEDVEYFLDWTHGFSLDKFYKLTPLFVMTSFYSSNKAKVKKEKKISFLQTIFDVSSVLFFSQHI